MSGTSGTVKGEGVGDALLVPATVIVNNKVASLNFVANCEVRAFAVGGALINSNNFAFPAVIEATSIAEVATILKRVAGFPGGGTKALGLTTTVEANKADCQAFAKLVIPAEADVVGAIACKAVLKVLTLKVKTNPAATLSAVGSVVIF